jgi:hypothetical protein
MGTSSWRWAGRGMGRGMEADWRGITTGLLKKKKKKKKKPEQLEVKL